MSKLVVGLAPNKVSFYDAKTNTYITLADPIVTVKYNENTDLSGICHACNCKVPALKLYEGKFPKDVLKAWKDKYDNIGEQAKKRADKIQENSKDIMPEEPVEEPEEPKVPEEEPEEPTVPEEKGPEDVDGEAEEDTGGIEGLSAASASVTKEVKAEPQVAKTTKKAATKTTTKKTTAKKESK